MDGILSSYMGLQAAELQQCVSMSVLNMAMNSGAESMAEMLTDLPQAVSAPPVAQGELGYNLDIYA